MIKFYIKLTAHAAKSRLFLYTLHCKEELAMVGTWQGVGGKECSSWRSSKGLWKPKAHSSIGFPMLGFQKMGIPKSHFLGVLVLQSIE